MTATPPRSRCTSGSWPRAACWYAAASLEDVFLTLTGRTLVED